MIADLAPKLKRTMVGRLLKRFKGRAMRMKDRGVLVGKVLSEPELFARVLSHDPYVWRVLADRRKGPRGQLLRIGDAALPQCPVNGVEQMTQIATPTHLEDQAASVFQRTRNRGDGRRLVAHPVQRGV